MHKIEKYAELLIKVGLNIQKDQTLVISSPIETAEFTRILTVKAYETGAREVVVRWLDEKSAKIRYDMASDEVFDEVPEWMTTFFTNYSKSNAAFLTISASDPELMKDVNPKRISRQSKAMNQALNFWRSRMMSNMNVWCVASIPTLAWAKKVFPYAENEEAMESLWHAILKSVRVDMDDPVEAWHQHQRDLNDRTDFLNDKKFKSLHFRNKLGTDLTIELPEGHVWFGGGDKGPDGQVFFANMPTEEVFTVPHMHGVNGKVYSSMPLNYNGNLIENIWFVFKDGLITDFGANNGVDTLKELLETDEGSKRLGEVALVPHDSPISNQGILFFNTLYDENASCHLALGKAYPTCLKDGASMSLDELIEAGVNDSLVHVDFMIGTKDMEIFGVTDEGSHVQVFSKGNFAIRSDE